MVSIIIKEFDGKDIGALAGLPKLEKIDVWGCELNKDSKRILDDLAKKGVKISK